MDINELAAEFGSSSKASSNADTGGIDVHGLAAEFGSGKTTSARDIGRPVISIQKGNPHPPQSDINGGKPEYYNETNVNPPATPQPFPLRPDVIGGNVVKDIVSNLGQGASTASEGLGDIVNRGELGSGAKKMGLGALGVVTAIPSGIASGAVSEPITQLTGNPDIGERAGLIAGGAIPIVPGASLLSKAMPSRVALKDLVDTISNNGANPENLVSVVQGMKSNPRLGPADLNPAVLSTTQKLFTTEGDASKNYLAKTSADRMASSSGAVKGAYDAAAGIPVDAIQKLKDLKEAAAKVGNEQIQPALAGAKPVDLSPVLEHIDSQLKPGVLKHVDPGSTLPLDAVKKQLTEVRAWLANDKEQLINPQLIHKVQSAFRKEAENLIASSDGANRTLGYSLMNVRNKLVDALDEASPKIKDAKGNDIGSYKPALAKYRGEKEIDEAFHNGYDGVLSNSKKMENLPEFTKEWVKDLTPHELEAAKEGIRLRIRAEMGTARNPSLAGQNIAKTEFNREKMEMILGKPETKKLLDELDAERRIANTHNKIVENSQTAMRLAGESKIKIPEKSPPASGLDRLAKLASWVGPEAANFYGTGYAVPGIGLAASLAANAGGRAATALKDKAKIALAKERNFQLSKMALPTEGPERDALIKSLEAAIPGPKQSIVRRGANALSRLVGP